jgi:4-hydroxy-tetrahydrodipicolinate reductase
MKIALIGYGKMGKAIEEIALQRGHTIVLKIDLNNTDEFNNDNLSRADAAIEFSGPHSAFDNIMKCLQAGTPVVSGSTGWLDKIDEVKNYCINNNGAFLYSSNYSIGVNIFFEVNKKLAALMSSHDEYNISVTEIHHTQKKDAPSGTAITLAEEIIENNPLKKSWINEKTNDKSKLEIISERIDPAPGTHKIKYSSAIDDIEIIHTAHSRQGFATGAVLAAEFIHHKKGVFGMNDVLGF